MPITGLRLTDVIGSGKLGLAARYTKNLELLHVQVNPASGTAFTIDSAKNALLDEATTLTNSPVLKLVDSTGTVVRSARE